MKPIYDNNFLNETLRNVFKSEKYYCIPKGVVRFDYGNVHGWWVRVTRDGAQFKQLFSDGKYGSIENSLNKAVLYRHEILSSFPITLKYIYSRGLPSDPEKRIKRIEEKGNKQPYISWKARWYDENHKVKNKCFSVMKFGEEEARLLALSEARKNHNKKPKTTNIPDNYFNHNYKNILRSDVEILASINSGSINSGDNSNSPSLEINPFAFEGNEVLVLHRSIERDKKIRAEKLKEFILENGKLFCELCGFNFAESYPFLNNDIIEVHHIVPLSTLKKTTVTTLSDLMLLCSNCHFAIHQGDAEENLIIALEHFDDDLNKYKVGKN